ncbi:MAG: helix-turn-helix domain-containing protein [Acidithiobacillus sp.]
MQTSVDKITAEIGRTLGYTPEQVPVFVDAETAAQVLGIKCNTLTNWRSTGRYALPFVKTGRLVRYRVSDLAEWIAQRRASGEV